jgi:hypothetical protein
MHFGTAILESQKSIYTAYWWYFGGFVPLCGGCTSGDIAFRLK